MFVTLFIHLLFVMGYVLKYLKQLQGWLKLNKN